MKIELKREIKVESLDDKFPRDTTNSDNNEQILHVYNSNLKKKKKKKMFNVRITRQLSSGP